MLSHMQTHTVDTSVLAAVRSVKSILCDIVQARVIAAMYRLCLCAGVYVCVSRTDMACMQRRQTDAHRGTDTPRSHLGRCPALKQSPCMPYSSTCRVGLRFEG